MCYRLLAITARALLSMRGQAVTITLSPRHRVGRREEGRRDHRGYRHRVRNALSQLLPYKRVNAHRVGRELQVRVCVNATTYGGLGRPRHRLRLRTRCGRTVRGQVSGVIIRVISHRGRVHRILFHRRPFRVTSGTSRRIQIGLAVQVRQRVTSGLLPVLHLVYLCRDNSLLNDCADTGRRRIVTVRASTRAASVMHYLGRSSDVYGGRGRPPRRRGQTRVKTVTRRVIISRRCRVCSSKCGRQNGRHDRGLYRAKAFFPYVMVSQRVVGHYQRGERGRRQRRGAMQQRGPVLYHVKVGRRVVHRPAMRMGRRPRGRHNHRVRARVPCSCLAATR